MITDYSYFIKNTCSIKTTLDNLMRQNHFFNFLLINEPQLIEVFHYYYNEHSAEPANSKTCVNNVLSKIDDIINDVATMSYSDLQCGEQRQCLDAAKQLFKHLNMVLQINGMKPQKQNGLSITRICITC